MIKKTFAPQAFTLIELLVVVFIISILASIAVPNFTEAQTRAKIARVKSDLRTLNMAIEAYRGDRNVPPHIPGLIDSNSEILDLADKYGYYDQDTIGGFRQANIAGVCLVTNLTTPIAYMTSVAIPDPFCPTNKHDELGVIQRWNQNAPHKDVMEVTIYIPYYYTPFYMNIVGMQKGWDRQIDPEHGLGPEGTDDHYANYLLGSLGPDYVKGPDPLVLAGSTWYLRDYCCTDILHKGEYVGGFFKKPVSINQITNDFRLWQYDPTNGTQSGGDILRWCPSEQERSRNRVGHEIIGGYIEN